MNKFKALLTKDFQIHKKSFMIPIWVTAAIYFLTLIAGIVAYFKTGIDINLGDLEFTDVDAPVKGITYLTNLFMMSFPSFLCAITAIMLAQSALNEDIKRNFELFHRSQPVSIWARSGSKFIITIGGTWVVLGLIAIFNALISGIILGYLHFFSFSGFLHGFLQGMIAYMKISLVLGGICFFASAIFKDKALLYTLLVLVGVQVLFGVINLLYGIHLPLPFNYLAELMETNVRHYEGTEFLQQDVSELISIGWREVLFNWKTLLQIAFSGVMFVGGTFIYKGKEVK